MARDKFGTEICVGDTICFTLDMRKDQKPIVRATIKDIVPFGYDFMAVCEYLNSFDVEWAKKEGKLPNKVSVKRVVKCY